jgi:hypothetical protein
MSEKPEGTNVTDAPLHEAIDLTANKDGGLLKKILRQGTGEMPPDGAQVRGNL